MLAPTLDREFSSLVNDVDERGLRQETLVIVTADFGRTSSINKNASRNHWPWAYSIALAGRGLATSTYYGSSDNAAAYSSPPTNPTTSPISPPRFIISWASHRKRHCTILGRPHPLVISESIEGVLA